jgi:hypothetical protein
VRIDLYRFLYYYLTPDDAASFKGRQSYKLVEWESETYADCEQIDRIVNDTKKSNVINALIGEGVNYCFYASRTNVLDAFYKLETSVGTGLMILDTTHTIIKKEYSILTKMLTGLLGRGYSYGVAPNTSGFPNIRDPVPLYAGASGDFPAGLEIGICGLSAGRRVLVRSVLMVQTGIGSFVTNEMFVISNSRDIW